MIFISAGGSACAASDSWSCGRASAYQPHKVYFALFVFTVVGEFVMSLFG